MLGPNNDWQWVHTRETLFLADSNGTPRQLLGNARNITEQKLAEKEIINTIQDLKAVNEELDGFVYRASHDLRAPLSSVLGLINLAKAEVKDANSLFYFDMIQGSIQKLINVTEDLIDHARNATSEIKFEKIDFNKIINEIIEGMRYHPNAAFISFDVKVADKTDFYSDRLRLILIFNNLISNAIKYHQVSKPNPYVKVHVTTNNDLATILIEDNGLGIDKQDKDKIFNMFYRANKTIPGTGLGLFIVKGALDKLNGTIQCEAELEKGCTFTVKIPNTKPQWP